MLTEEDRKYILDSSLQEIWCISSKDYQRRVWIKGIGPECDSFDETVNHFSPAADAIIQEYKDFRITEEQLNLLRRFRDVFSDFCEKRFQLPQEFIDTPEWERITEMAKGVLHSFNYNRKETKCFEEKKHFILNQFLYNLYNISDIEYQKRVWVRKEGPEVDDLEEAVRFFIEYGKMIVANYKGYGLSESQLQLLFQFDDTLETFVNNNRLPQVFINSNEWEQITQAAKDLLKSFNYKKPENLNKENIKCTINHLLRMIPSILNTQDEERTWVIREDAQRNDLTQIASPFFAEVEPVLEHFKGYGLSANQYELLKDFSSALRGFLNRALQESWVVPLPRLDDWGKVREKAKNVLLAFNYKPSEMGS